MADVRVSIILRDISRAHTADAVKDLLRCWQWEILELYSPDMNLCDYDLFAKMKEPLRGTRYNTREDIIWALGWTHWTSTEVDALMVYDIFHKFGRRWYTWETIVLKECKCVYLK
jgi:hypothetical protein